jgi:hypothetical protein
LKIDLYQGMAFSTCEKLFLRQKNGTSAAKSRMYFQELMARLKPYHEVSTIFHGAEPAKLAVIHIAHSASCGWKFKQSPKPA